jgi:signal transduction histidine kinase
MEGRPFRQDRAFVETKLVIGHTMQELETSAARGNRRILILDDSPAVQRDFRRILCGRRRENPGLQASEMALFGDTDGGRPELRFSVTSVLQGEDGVRKAELALQEGQPFALVFVDLRMPPGWDGITTASRLWTVDSHLEVVLCTAYSDFSWEEITRRLGRSDQFLILKKPFEAIEVMQLARSLTDKWNLAEAARQHTRELERRVAERTRQWEQQIQERERVEHQRMLEAERSRVARDLHDELGSGLTEISMLGDRAQAAVASPEKRQQYLAQIGEISKQMVTALDEIVWAMNPEHDSLESFISYSCIHAERFLSLANITWRLEGTDHIPECPLDSPCRHELFLAFKEALTNVVRHSGATEVRLGFAFGADRFQLIVADNGRGLPGNSAVLEGDGLSNIQTRLAKYGGRLELQSSAALGTSLRFEIPLRPP